MSEHLTDKQETFVVEFFKTNNQRQAYLTAFPHSRKWKETSVDVKASQLIKTDKVQIRLQELRDHAKENSKITIEQVVQEIALLAFQDVGNLFTEDGTLKHVSSMKPEVSKTLSEVTVRFERPRGRGGEDSGEVAEIVKMKTTDKSKALDMLMRHLGGYAPEKHEHSGEIRTGMDSFYATVKPDEE